MAFDINLYRGKQCGYDTRIRQGDAGELEFWQVKDGGMRFVDTDRAAGTVDLITFNEKQLRRLLNKRHKARK